MDYKNTLNLPQTGFPMKADLVAREPERLKAWQSAGLYQEIQKRRAGAPKFVLHDGPPFANGDVHVGTALNKILKDIIVRYQSLRGQDAPYVPGWDCHGLPIEFKVVQELRKSGKGDPDAATIRRECDAYARRYIDLQRTQFKRLGILGEWENPYLTLDRRYEADELRMFADILEKGFVYRGKKPVYWSIPCRTALAEAEVEYADHVSQSVYVRFPVVDHPGTYVLIWTTTPWTLPANLAVAYNSTFSYSVVRAGAEFYIVSTLLLTQVAEKCGWGGYEILRTLYAEHLEGLEYEHPFCNRRGKFLAGDSFVENSTGTGFVHIAPGHGLEDYSVGRQNNLPIYSPVDDEGRLAWTNDLPRDQQMPEALVGKSILEKNGKSEANEAVIAILKERNALVHQEDYLHSYPHCWRSKTAVIFRAMDQWFINVDHEGFRDRAVETIQQKVEWVPDWGRNRIESAVKARPDWCISRQRAWGVPIPAFYDADGNAILQPAIVREVARLFEEHGSNAWFELPLKELWSRVKPAGYTGAEPASKSNDTLDVWIDSGSSSRSVLMRRPELWHGPKGEPVESWQSDIYLEGTDQHRGWFQSSLLLSLAGNGAAPYRTVLTHGFMVDADREKISKSKQGQGGYEKPQTSEAYVKKYGADVLRLWVASQDFRNDIIVSEERINKVSEMYRVIRNALRYQLSNLYDFDPAAHAAPEAGWTPLDRWILDRFGRLESDVSEAYGRYEFHVVYQKVSQFAAVELSAVYHDLVKDRLYTDPASSARRRSTQTALYEMVTRLAKLLSPILTFTADEAWEFLPKSQDGSVHLSTWEPSKFRVAETERAKWDAWFALRDRVLPEIEKARQQKLIGKSLEARVALALPDPALLSNEVDREIFREILNVSQLLVSTGSEEKFVIDHAEGQKCERCWHWELAVGKHAAHPGLCGRCVAAVDL